MPKTHVERTQTGVRLEKNLLKVLKGLAEYCDISLGDLEGNISVHTSDGDLSVGTLKGPAIKLRTSDGDVSAASLEAPRIEPQLVKYGRVNVGDIVPVLDGMKTEFIGRTVGSSSLDSATRHPDGKAEVVVTSPVRTLAAGSAAELRAPDYERFVEESSLPEVLQ